MKMIHKTLVINSGDSALKTAVELLNNGDVIAMPTETVYGLCARCDNMQGVKGIFKIKNRPADNPLILHCDGVDMALKYIDNPDDRFFKLTQKFWPGPLTIVTTRSTAVGDIVTGGQNTVALRMPKNEFFLKVISGCGVPIAAPSANISGRPSPTDAQEVYNQLNTKVPLIVDGGRCSVGVESTIVSITGGEVSLLRPGDITRAEIEEVIGGFSIKNKNELPIAPGMKYRHYAPSCEVTLYCGDNFPAYLADKKGSYGVVCYEEEQTDISAEHCIIFGRADDEKHQQHNLFKILNSLDSYGLERWYIHTEKNFEAVFNRLHKASQGRVDTL